MRNRYSEKKRLLILNQVKDITYKKLAIVNRNNLIQYFSILIFVAIIVYWDIDIKWYWLIIAGFIISGILSFISKQQQDRVESSYEINDLLYEIEEDSGNNNFYDQAQMTIQLTGQNGIHSYITVCVNPEFCKRYDLKGNKLFISISDTEVDWENVFIDDWFSVLKKSIQSYFIEDKSRYILIEIKEVVYHSRFIELQAEIASENHIVLKKCEKQYKS